MSDEVLQGFSVKESHISLRKCFLNPNIEFFNLQVECSLILFLVWMISFTICKKAGKGYGSVLYFPFLLEVLKAHIKVPKVLSIKRRWNGEVLMLLQWSASVKSEKFLAVDFSTSFYQSLGEEIGWKTSRMDLSSEMPVSKMKYI